jgi:hypothetical protein
MFEKLIIGYKIVESVGGVYIKKDVFEKNIIFWIKFFKKEDIEYMIFHNGDSFIILFPKLYNDIIERKKFPKDSYNENKPYLLTINDEGVEICEIFKDYLDGFVELKSRNLKDLEIEIRINKYNL